MTTIQTHKGELIVLEVNLKAQSIKMDGLSGNVLWIDDRPRILPAFLDYSIIGTSTNGELDFDCEPYVEFDVDHDTGLDGDTYMFLLFKDYATNVLKSSMTKEASFLSLLTSHKLEYANTKLVFLKREK